MILSVKEMHLERERRVILPLIKGYIDILSKVSGKKKLDYLEYNFNIPFKTLSWIQDRESDSFQKRFPFVLNSIFELMWSFLYGLLFNWLHVQASQEIIFVSFRYIVMIRHFLHAHEIFNQEITRLLLQNNSLQELQCRLSNKRKYIFFPPPLKDDIPIGAVVGII